MATLSSGIINIWVFGIGPIFHGMIVKMLGHEDINRYPQYIYMYYLYLISPGLMGLTALVMFFINHEDVRKTISGKIKELFTDLWRESIKIFNNLCVKEGRLLLYKLFHSVLDQIISR